MASAAYRESQWISSAQAAPKGVEESEAASGNKPRLCRARNRLMLQSVFGLSCDLLFYFSLSHLLGPVFIPYQNQTAGLLLLFMAVPLLTVGWRNWIQARRGIAELGIVGTLSKTELAHVATQRMAMRDELRDSQPYIDVMQNQIGDSLAESERYNRLAST